MERDHRRSDELHAALPDEEGGRSIGSAQSGRVPRKLGDTLSVAWDAYTEKNRTRPLRSLFSRALAVSAAPGSALDLGCGSGQESAELCRRGWQVTAIDGEATA